MGISEIFRRQEKETDTKETYQKPEATAKAKNRMGTKEPPVVTAHTPDHGPHPLRLGHAALLQPDHQGGAKRHAAGHVATSTSRTGSRALFRRPDKVGTMGCQDYFEPYGLASIAVLDG